MISLNILPPIDSLPKPDSLNAVQTEIAALVEKVTTTPTTELLMDMVNAGVSFGLKLIAAFVIYIVGAWLIKRIKSILNKAFTRKGTDAPIASFVQSITSIVLTIILVIVTIGTVGIDTSSIAALLTGGGLAIGMALNGTMQNFAGGLMILIFKPFKSGDFIEAQGYSGTVSELSITSTKLVTTDNRVIIIPNGVLSNNIINNFSDQKYRRVDLTIDVEYGSSADQVKKLLGSMIESDSRILKTPAEPFIALSALKESSVQFTMRLWVNASDYWNVYYELTEKIYKELPENDIHFPFPQLDINIKSNN